MQTKTLTLVAWQGPLQEPSCEWLRALAAQQGHGGERPFWGVEAGQDEGCESSFGVCVQCILIAIALGFKFFFVLYWTGLAERGGTSLGMYWILARGLSSCVG